MKCSLGGQIHLLRSRRAAYWFLVPLLLSFAFFWRLSDLPPGVDHFDVCYNIQHVRTVLSGELPLYFTETNREPALYYWAAPFSALVSDPFHGLKLALAASAAISALALFAGQRAQSNVLSAVVAVVVLVSSTWYTNILRSGYRAALAVTCFAFLYAAWQPDRPTRRRIIALSVVLALGCYTYTVFWLYAPLCCLLFGLLVPSPWRERLRTSRSLLLLTASFLLPLFWVMANDPRGVFFRQMGRSEEISTLGFSAWTFVRSVAENYVVTYRTVFHTQLLNYQVEPFTPALAPFALLGAVRLAVRRGNGASMLVLATLLYAPLSGALMSAGFPAEVPDPPRNILLVPVICILCATGADLLRSWLGRLRLVAANPGPAAAIGTGVILLATALLFTSWQRYLVVTWPGARRLGSIPLYRELADSSRGAEPLRALVGDWDLECLAAYGIRGEHVPVDAVDRLQSISVERIVTHPDLSAAEQLRVRASRPDCRFTPWRAWGTKVSYVGVCPSPK